MTRRLRHGDRVATRRGAGAVIDVHSDGVHVSVLPDHDRRALVRLRLEDLEDLP